MMEFTSVFWFCIMISLMLMASMLIVLLSSYMREFMAVLYEKN